MRGDRRARRLSEQPGLRWVCFGITWLTLVASGASGQLFDAAVYVDSAMRLVDGVAPPDAYAIRGALTQLVYVPAALGTKVGLTIETGVLLQNAALLAALGAFLLPALVARCGARTQPVAASAWCCLGVLVLLGRFAPVGHMDIWSIAVVIGALVLLARPSPVHLVVAGALFGAAFNLRPAYLLPVGLLVLASVLVLRLRWFWLVIGAAMGVVPQWIQELLRPGTYHVWSDGLGAINDTQLVFSTWVVRYDTVISGSVPQQFFCDPDMAAVQQDPVSSVSQLVGQLVTFVPQSVDLVAQKLTAWLMWTWSTPYYDPTEPRISQLSVVVAAVVVVGCLGWVQAFRRGDLPMPVAVGVASMALGVLGSGVAATPEARFALPLVVLGLAGCVLVRFESVTTTQAAGTVLLVVAVVLLGKHGLSHPAPPGPVDSSICTTTGSAP